MMRLVLFLVLVSAAVSVSAQTSTIRMAVAGTLPGTPVARGAELYRDEVNKRLEGRARIEIVDWSGNLFAGIQRDEADIFVAPSSSLAAQKTPTLALFDLPFFFRHLTEVSAMQKTAIGDAMLTAVNRDLLVGLAYWNTGMSRLFGHKPVSTAADFKGLKLHTTVSPAARIAVQHLGVVPYQVALPNIVAAMNTGNIDAFELPPTLVGYGWLQPTSYSYSNINFRPFVSVVAASEKFWKGARYRVQLVLAEEARSIATRVNAAADELDKTATAKLSKDHPTVTPTATQFDALSKAALPGWLSVADLQKDGFLQVALSTRDELRRTKYNVPEKKRGSTQRGPYSNVFFLTDRTDDKDSDPDYRFAGTRGGLTFGRAEVEVDPRRPLGSGDTDSIRLVSIVTHSTKTGFLADMNQQLGRYPHRAILVYVHGFRTPFKRAVESAAQIAADTRFVGATIAFSWPSDGAVVRYPYDEEQVQGSRNNFVTALHTFSEIVGIEKIHLITHSMGARLAANALEWLNTQPAKGRPRLDHLILAAPDIGVHQFKEATPGMRGVSKNITLYSSEKDQALQCSLIYHGGLPRAGQAGPHIVVMEKLDTVDASAVERRSGLPLPCTSGHSYISENPAVLSDLYELLAYDAEPARRQRLRPGKKDGLTYWLLR